MNKHWLIVLLLAAGCATRRLPATQTISSFAQPESVIAPASSVTVLDHWTFQWTDDDPSVDHFNLYYSWLFPNQYDHAIWGITNLNCVVSNLMPGKVYYLAATAVNTYGVESDFSEQYVFVMPTTLEMGFTFGGPVTNVAVQSSNDLMTWQESQARLGTNGLWRIDVEPGTRAEFYRGIGQAAPAP
jgi:hypothetical protein